MLGQGPCLAMCGYVWPMSGHVWRDTCSEIRATYLLAYLPTSLLPSLLPYLLHLLQDPRRAVENLFLRVSLEVQDTGVHRMV